MALNIKNPETQRLARELAEITEKSMTQAVTEALRKALNSAKRGQQERNEGLIAELDAIAEHCAALPVLDTRLADDILGYDERGLST